MKLRQRRRWMCLMGLGLLSACATQEPKARQPAVPVATPAPPAWNFETEWTRAAAESAPGTVGQAWEKYVNATLEDAYGAVIDDCATPFNPSDPGATSDRRFVLAIGGDGSVRQVWSEIDSPLLTCARASLSRTRFAPPPRDGYRMGLLLGLGDPDVPQQFSRLPRPAPGPISSDEAMGMAVTDMGTVEGQPYMEGFSSTFLAALGSFVKECMMIPLHETEQSLQGYRLLIEIAADGATQRVLVEPDPETAATGKFHSPRADCLRDGLIRARVAMPPWDGFWVHTNLDNPPPGFPTK